MNIDHIPATYDEMERFNSDYERAHFAYTDAGHRVATAMIDMFLNKMPAVPKRLGRRAIYALLDEPLLDALGLPRPTPTERRVVERALELRAKIVALLPPRRKPRIRTELRRRTYPDGYRIEQLGPT
jgi:hypothetical protein